MDLLAFQHHILKLAISVLIYPGLLALPGICHDLPLQLSRFPGIRPHIISLIPDRHILFHRLAVKKDYGNARFLRLIYDHCRYRTIYHIHADRVIAFADKVIHLVILAALAVLSIRDIYNHLFPQLLFFILDLILQ